MEHRGDIADQAEAQESSFRELSLKAIADKLVPRFHPDFDGEHCMECGVAIELGRLKLQKINCVECQTAKEALAKRFGGR